MIVLSIIVSYVLTMTVILRDNFTHQRNKLYQALLMGAYMALIMTGISIYQNGRHSSKQNILIFGISVTSIIILTILIRQQITIDQDQFMLSMIEHHQMAIDMAKLVKPKVTDRRLDEIVNNIITSQTSEITQMYQILDDRGVSNTPISLFI